MNLDSKINFHWKIKLRKIFHLQNRNNGSKYIDLETESSQDKSFVRKPTSQLLLFQESIRSYSHTYTVKVRQIADFGLFIFL